jgi:uncharacterized iron-regulated membrane protein
MEKLTNKPHDASKPVDRSKKIYRTLWRWHFYAGVFAIPFVIVLSISGAIYLFKPQIDAFHDRPYRNLLVTGEAQTPERHLAAALAAVPRSSFFAYELPREKNDAVNILVTQADKKIRVYVHPQTLSVLATELEDDRFLHIIHDLHGELLLGKTGSILVELAACWAIVLMLTGIYLWWPRNAKGLAGILYPRIACKGRLFWRDVHSVIGIWVAFFVLFLLISGLPWALVWGSAFKEFRQVTGTAAQKQDWVISRSQASDIKMLDTTVLLNKMITSAQALNFAYPVLVSPPSTKSPTQWTVKSNAQNRTLRNDAYFDAQTGELIGQQHFSQRHVIDRVVSIGIAAHEGQLFGWFNQLLGLLTALGLVSLSVAGFIMWRKRAPKGVLGAPPAIPEANIGLGFVTIIVVAAILLPVLGASLILLAIVEKIVLSRWTVARNWLGAE